MAIRTPFRRGILGAFARAKSGLAAIEFALVLPIMVLLYLSGFEITEAFMINRKVTHATSALGDLVAQARSINNNEMNNILDAVTAVMNPYPTNNAWMRVSGVRIDNDGVARVVWSDARNTTAHPANTVITIPISVVQNQTFIVVAEVSYAYTPTFGHALVGVIDLNDSFYLRPRLQNEVTRN